MFANLKIYEEEKIENFNVKYNNVANILLSMKVLERMVYTELSIMIE